MYGNLSEKGKSWGLRDKTQWSPLRVSWRLSSKKVQKAINSHLTKNSALLLLRVDGLDNSLALFLHRWVLSFAVLQYRAFTSNLHLDYSSLRDGSETGSSEFQASVDPKPDTT